MLPCSVRLTFAPRTHFLATIVSPMRRSAVQLPMAQLSFPGTQLPLSETHFSMPGIQLAGAVTQLSLPGTLQLLFSVPGAQLPLPGTPSSRHGSPLRRPLHRQASTSSRRQAAALFSRPKRHHRFMPLSSRHYSLVTSRSISTIGSIVSIGT